MLRNDREGGISEGGYGVILTVAITIMLAVFVTSNVMSMSEEVRTTYIISTSAHAEPNGDIVINYLGGVDQDKLALLEWWVLNSNNETDYGNQSSPQAGLKYTSTVKATSGKDRVYIVATFVDAAKILVLDEYF